MAKAPTREQIIERVREAGVVGAGGGGFPAHVKLDAKVEIVIANGAECEPLVRVDQQEMASRPAELLRGVELAMAATGASQGVIALKKKYGEAIERLEETIARRRLGSRVRLHILQDFYPAGDEHVLVREVTGKVIPELGIPLKVGALVANVSSLINIAKAVDKGAPVVSRGVTVAGAVKRPSSFQVPLGTPFSALIEAAGGLTSEDARLIAGGPMMGSLVDDPALPVTKTTSMIIALPESSPVVQRRLRDVSRQLQLTRSACLKCMMCSEVCPRNLLGHRLYPDRLMRSLAADVAEDLEAYTGAYLCSECGLCATYACVMNLDPCYMNREMKRRLSEAGVPRPDPVETQARVFQTERKVPSKRLIARLGLSGYDLPAPFAPFQARVQRFVVPLRQHAGAPALAVVKAGDAVREGDLLGEIPEGALGARIHAGVSGRVTAASESAVTIEVE
ncbi:MAG: SLBB domain-containing protein [Myxococcota bacterium]